MKIRDDLILSERTEGNETHIIVKDPKRRKFFRLGELEFLILQELDGKTLLEDIQRALLEKHNLAVSTADLEGFVEGLREKHLLSEKAAVQGEALAERSPWTVSKGLLHIKIPLFNPDNLLARLTRPMGFLFTPYFLVFSVGLTAFGIVVTFLHWDGITAHLSSFRQAGNLILLVWIIQLFSISIHELSHGVTCKHFGGEVTEMGFLLLLLVVPCIYCNLNDIRLFNSRSKRLGVLIAGIYSGLLLWGIGAIMWLIAPKGTIWRDISSCLIINSGILSLLNINPLIKLDGYYILSDCLNIPNLRSKSFEFLRSAILRRTVKTTRKVTKREKAIYFTYGVLATVYSALLLTFGMWTIGTSVMQYL